MGQQKKLEIIQTNYRLRFALNPLKDYFDLSESLIIQGDQNPQDLF